MQSIRRRLALGFLGGLCVLLAGCSSAQFNGTEYRDKEVAFRLGPVSPALRVLQADDAKVAFQNDQAGATVAVSARCGLDSDDVPLQALAQHLFLQLTERELIDEKKLTLDGRDALELEILASLDGVPRHFVVVVLKKNGCVYDFLHVDAGGNSSNLQDSRADFRAMVYGFRTLERPQK